jgi:hypothetical protein
MSRTRKPSPKEYRQELRAEHARTEKSCDVFHNASRIGLQSHWQRWETWDVDDTLPLRQAVPEAGVRMLSRLHAEIEMLTITIEANQ